MLQKCINPKNVNWTQLPWDKKHLHFGAKFNPLDNFYTLNCGLCIYCQQKYSNDWAVRLMLEGQLHAEKCFITLTYNEENLPHNGSLQKRDTQLFIKRLRKKLYPQKVRYFLAGEYGGRRGRPHYHMVLFGFVPKDLTYLKHTGKNEIIFKSNFLANIWKKGYISVGINMTLNALKYVAKYLSKLSNYDPVTQNPPFSTQSNRPGIGAGAFTTAIYETDGIYLEGKKWSVPRYFDKLAEQQEFDLTVVKQLRDQRVKQYGNIMPTLNEKREYNISMLEQGYNSDHLFMPSHKKMLSHFLAFDSDGVADIEFFKEELYNYLVWHKNTFFDTHPVIKHVEKPKLLKWKQISMYDLLEKVYF